MKSTSLKLMTVVSVLLLAATSQAALIDLGFEVSEGFTSGNSVIGSSIPGGSITYEGTQDDNPNGYLVSDVRARNGGQSVALSLPRDESTTNFGTMQVRLDGDTVTALTGQKIRLQHSVYKFANDDLHRYRAFKTGCCECCSSPGGEMFQLGIGPSDGGQIRLEAGINDPVQFQAWEVEGIGTDEGWYDVTMDIDFGASEGQQITGLTVNHPGIGLIDFFQTATGKGGSQDGNLLSGYGNAVGFRGDHFDAENAKADRLSTLLYSWNDPDGGHPASAYDSISVSIIPEPASCLLMVVGLVGLLGLRRRTR